MSRRRNRRGSDDELRVNSYSETWLKRGFPWVYPKEVTSGRVRRVGAEVAIRNGKGQVLGRGLSDVGWLAARVYRHGDGPLDADHLGGLIDRALRLRRAVVDDDTSAWRIVHGENDGLPGLRLDWWDGWITAILDSPAVSPILDRLLPVLNDRLKPHGVYRCYRPDPRDDRDAARFEPAAGWLDGGRTRDEVAVRERGLQMWVRPWEGPDVGMYLDMREVRRWLEPHWRDRRVLNTFAYTGLFSVAAAAHGAREVVSVDLGRPVLDRLADNLRLNGLDPVDDHLVCEDTFKAFDRYRRKGRRFDLVILDPPSFSHGPSGTWSTKQTPRLVSAAARVLDPGGWIVAASNHGQTSPKAFRGMVAEGCRKAGREAQEIAWLSAAPDFPCATSFPEAHYLKVGVWALD